MPRMVSADVHILASTLNLWIVADIFQKGLSTALPGLMNLLKYQSSYVQENILSAFSELAKHGKKVHIYASVNYSLHGLLQKNTTTQFWPLFLRS